jgi:hypothetical protein
MTGFLSDAKVLFEALNAAGEWLQRALKAARKKGDREAAQVLHDAFVVVASMRAYDNAFRPLVGQLVAFSTRWDRERREQLGDHLELFFDVEQILPRYRQSFEALRTSAWQGAGHEALGRLVGAASTFGDEIVGPIWKEKENYVVRVRMLNALRYGKSSHDADAVHQWAQRVAAVLDRGLLAEADTAFGQLRRAVLAAHDLPDPGYAVSLG